MVAQFLTCVFAQTNGFVPIYKSPVNTTTLIIIIVVLVLLFGGGGYFYRRGR